MKMQLTCSTSLFGDTVFKNVRFSGSAPAQSSSGYPRPFDIVEIDTEAGTITIGNLWAQVGYNISAYAYGSDVSIALTAGTLIALVEPFSDGGALTVTLAFNDAVSDEAKLDKYVLPLYQIAYASGKYSVVADLRGMAVPFYS